ncbi:hypothetical protein ACLUW2_09440 [Limosilactobacillus balticus]|uniref:hypothetical protein n=1 Tax=Limosilactobacillus balticus TaxID=2759747 RepID=UPI0039942CAA
MNSRIYTSIFKLKNITTLKEIEQWRTEYFDDPVKHSKHHQEEFEQLPDEERNYRYSWNNINKVESLPFSSNGKDINFIEASAHIEYAKRKIFDSNHHFLPKNDRTNLEDIDIIFFEMDEKFFILIEESREKQIDRVLRLIGEANYEKVENLSSDFFNWLVYLYSENEGKLNSNISITSISSFLGNVFDDENVVSSKSEETMKLIATRAFISTGGILREVKMNVDDSNNYNICFKMDDQCSTVISINEAFPYMTTNALEKSERIILYMYTSLLPCLQKMFQAKKDSFKNKKKKFAKKIGLQVVKEIMNINNIHKDEIA